MGYGKPSAHFIIRIPRSSIYIAGLCLMLVVLYWAASRAGASSVTYVPSSCAGDWHDPEKALTGAEGSLFDFRDSESTYSDMSGQKLFCSFGGEFEGRDIESIELVLRFVPATYLAVADTVSEPTATSSDALDDMSTSTPEETSGGFFDASTSTPEIPPAGESIPSNSEPEATPSSDAASQEPTDEPAATSAEPAPTPAEPDPAGEVMPAPENPSVEPPAATEPSEGAPVSRLWRFIASVAHAQEPEPAPASATTSEDAATVDVPTAEVSLQSTQEGSVPQEPEPAPMPAEGAGNEPGIPRINVSYMTASTLWQDLGDIEGDDLRREIRIPLSITRTQDLQTLVVKIDSAEMPQPVYLDSVSVEVVYVELEDVLESEAEEPILEDAVASDERTLLSLTLNDATVFAIIRKDARDALYRISESGTERVVSEIAGPDEVSASFLAAKEGWIFWIHDDGNLYGYDAYADRRYSAPLEYDEAEAETVADITAFPYTIVYRPTHLLFRDPERGEMYADAIITTSEREDAIR